MQKKLLLLCLLFAGKLSAQWNDSAAVDDIIYSVMNNAESITDSLFWYANAVEQSSKKINYKNGQGSAIRLRGLYYQLSANYDSAMYYFMQLEQFGIREHVPKSQAGALSSQFEIHLTLKQYEEARKKAFAAIAIGKQNGFQKQVAVNYSNIGITWRRQKNYDSAFYYYRQALEIRKQMKDSTGIINTNVNISGLLLYMKKFDEALDYVYPNLAYHKQRNDSSFLWNDYTTLALLYGQKKEFKKALSYLDTAKNIAIANNYKVNQAETYKSYGEVYYAKGDWQLAYDNLLKGTEIEAENINATTSEQLLELEKKYKTEQKEQQNKLLAAEIDNQKLQKRNVWIAASALALIAAVSMIYWRQNRKKKIQLETQNKLINEQNKKLTELNEDKNQLISMVSHDLGQPLNNIRVWTEILGRQNNNEAIEHIKTSLQYGQQLIRNVLDVERATANQQALHFETTGINGFIQYIIKDFTPAAQSKNIQFHFEPYRTEIFLNTGRQHLQQVLENLISNALKFSQPGKSVYISAEKNAQQIMLCIKDEGPGMDENELKQLFNKYSIGTAKPTAGEASTGLGLSIVKRLMLELGGKIYAESEPGKGTAFTLIFES